MNISQKSKRIIFILCLPLAAVAVFWGVKENSAPEKITGASSLVDEKIDPLKIGIISDIHSCSGFRDELTPFVDNANGQKTDFNVSLGDNINFNVGRCDETYREDLEWVFENLKKVSSPFHFVLGDHDIWSDPETVDFWREKTGQKENFYSFGHKGFHIVILDTILGGEEMQKECQDDSDCRAKKEEAEFYKGLKNNPEALEKFLKDKNITLEEFTKIRKEKTESYSGEEDRIKNTRSGGKRDKGRIAENQLEWLRADLKKAPEEKVIVFAHHPLFRFQNEEKLYDIVNREKLSRILEESKKQIVCLSADAHTWHEEKIGDIRFYVIDRYRNSKGSWAFFEWDQNGPKLTKISGGWNK